MMETGASSSDKNFANFITGSKADNNLFCCVCCKPIYAAIKLKAHIRSYEHKICVQRCKSAFEDRGEKVFCKTCEVEIEWKEIEQHGIIHKIPPWCKFTKPTSENFYDNHTVFFSRGYYFCYLCEKFLDYWDTASSHFMEADHQDLKEMRDVSTVDWINIAHLYNIGTGIIPGWGMTTECKMCDKIGLKVEDIEEHLKTVEHKENTRKTAANIFQLQEPKQNSAVLKISSLDDEESNSELLKTDSLTKDDTPKNILFGLKRNEQEKSSYGAFANVFIEKKKNLFCCACCKYFKNVERHTVSFNHCIYVKRCKTMFEDRGEKVYCKTCKSEIEWTEIQDHVQWHKIRPWYRSGKPKSQTFFHNHTVKFSMGMFYCFLCEIVLDYWDTAISHFMEADHQQRKKMFGPIELVETNYVLAVTQGIVPGKDMMNECKMCNVTGLEAKDIKEHFKTVEHKENKEKFTADAIKKHEGIKYQTDSESKSLDTEESTSKLLEADVLAKGNKSKNMPYSCNMIFNSSLQESSESAIPERNENSRESENVCKTKTEKAEANSTTELEKRRNYADSESDSSEFEESTSERLKESRNMIFNFSLQESLNSTPERTDSSNEARNIITNFPPIAKKQVEISVEALRFNKITGLKADKNLFCCVCNKITNAKLKKHLRKYGHKIRLNRCQLTFEDRGENVFCKICSCEIEWNEIVHHGEIHEIPPWSELTKPSSETFYRNRTVLFAQGYCYCYLCKIFLDYWDKARSHFMEPDHQKRKEKFGPIATLEGINYHYVSAVVNGILPGPEMTYECKMCNKTGLNIVDINHHPKTREHRKRRDKTAKKMLNKHKEKQNFAYSEPNRNITSNFSLQISPKMAPKEHETPKESGKADSFHPSSNVAFANAIVNSKKSTDILYCYTCCQPFVIWKKHHDSYKHKVFLNKFKLFFEDCGEKVFCKTCSSEIEWKAIKHHVKIHEIPPWTEQGPITETFFRNHTTKFTPGYCYCFLCEKFLDYWDTAESHFNEAVHQKRKDDFGPIVDLQKYKSIVKRFTPGKNKMFDCKMCNKTGTRTDIIAHSRSKTHKKNHERFTTAIVKKYEETQNFADSISDSANTAASTSEPLKPVPPKEDEIPKKIQVPYRRDMICNFTLQEIPDQEIPEAKESLINDQPIDGIECTKLPVQEKPPESAKVVLESINQNDDWPIKYIVSSTSNFCKSAIIGTDMQRKRKIAKQNTDEPDPYCLICYSEIPGPAAVNDHLNGKRHETARQKYGCDNILLIEGENYWCSACDGPVSGFNNVYRHITSNSHLSAIVRMQNTNHDSQNNIDQVVNVIEAEESLPCLYIVKRNAKKSFCQICDETQHPLATKNINDHIASQRHKISLKRYGCDNIVPKGNDNYYCKCCLCNLPNIESVYLHIKDKKHISSLIKVCDNEGQRGKRRIETRKLPENLNEPFQNLLSSYITKQINKFLPSETDETLQYSMMSNFNVEPNHADRTTFSDRFEPPEQNSTPSRNSESFGFISHDDFTEVKRKTEELRGRGQKMSALEYEAQAKKICCNVCGVKTEDTTELHIHMASHYTEEFATAKSKRVRRTDKNNHQQTPQSLLVQSEVVLDDKLTNGVAINGFSNPTGECSNQEIAKINSENNETEIVTKSGVTIQDNEKKNRKHSARLADMKKVTQLLNFNEDHIYELDDKLEEVEFGMMLGLVVDSSKMYCLICRTVVEYTLDNYNEHLENIDHCQYLDEMEADDKYFQDLENQFSDLDLAKDYMEEISRDKVRCVICDEDVRNNARSLQAHIYHEIHERKCEETRAIARKCFGKIKPRMNCSWYDVQKYWCVICESDTESEVKFMQHFNKKKHRQRMKSRENREKRLIFDFCAPCAVLWYGYRCTHSYHNDIDSHKWLQRDGHYVLTELPKFVKSLLASPEDFVDDKIKFLDEVFENEVKREKWLIRDLEKAAKMRFPRSKAYVFGSRITGLGSPDSDIDVFLDCRNLYDGNNLKNDELLFFINGVHQCLCKDPQLWDVDELLTECRIPIIKATHRATELSCDISFENGLSVENTKLIKAFNEVFPLCRKLTLFLKHWLQYCDLSGSRGITNYALYWYVIFFLQHESILPSVETLIAMGKRSHIIAGWEVGVTYNFTYHGDISNFTIKKLLIKFFEFYANFDFRYNVACPLLGEVVEKRDFINPRSLPRKMERYIAYMRGPGKPQPFRIDSPMCIQDPFDLQHNLTKAVNKVYLNRFKKCCDKSLEILRSS